MPPVKPTAQFNWKKSLYWLSPLFLLSLGIHGLAMLIPLPEAQKEAPKIVEERQLESPPSIDVATLPSSLTTPSTVPPQATFTPARPTAPTPPASIAPARPASVSAPASPAPTLPAPASPTPASPAPRSTPTSPAATSPAPGSTPTSPAPTSPASGSTPTSPAPTSSAPTVIRQPYDAQRTSPSESTDALTSFVADTASLYNVSPKLIRNVFTLAYPAGGRCFEDASTGKEYDFLDSSIAVIVGNVGDQDNPRVGFLEADVIQSTGFESADDWIRETVSAEASEVTLEWIRANAKDAQFDSTLADESYMFPIKLECE